MRRLKFENYYFGRIFNSATFGVNLFKFAYTQF